LAGRARVVALFLEDEAVKGDHETRRILLARSDPFLPRRLWLSVRLLEAAVGEIASAAAGGFVRGRGGAVEVRRRVAPGDVPGEKQPPAVGGGEEPLEPADELRLFLGIRTVFGIRRVADLGKGDRPVLRALEEALPVCFQGGRRPVPVRLVPLERGVDVEE